MRSFYVKNAGAGEGIRTLDPDLGMGWGIFCGDAGSRQHRKDHRLKPRPGVVSGSKDHLDFGTVVTGSCVIVNNRIAKPRFTTSSNADLSAPLRKVR
jgi:hypothetical protein